MAIDLQSEIEGVPTKKVGPNYYILRENLGLLQAELWERIYQARKRVDEEKYQNCNVIKVSDFSGRVSFLRYQNLETNPFPKLISSMSVSIDTERVTERRYDDWDSPPILHRKELLFGETHPRYDEFATLTRILEKLGLFSETSRIGRSKDWERLIKERRITIDGHKVIPAKASNHSISQVQRHRTALVRNSLSLPFKAAFKNNLICEDATIFDYGCGRGDDVKLLQTEGFDVVGWDPHFAPDGKKRASDIVNLGYVLNVVEDPIERLEVLEKAFSYANKLLVVSALSVGAHKEPKGRRFRDGVITQRGTFQKYFEHSELGEFISSGLGSEPVSLGTGIYAVFKTDIEREEFLSKRRRVTQPSARRRLKPDLLDSDEDREFAQRFWDFCIGLARQPTQGEVPSDLELWVYEKFKTHKRAFNWFLKNFDQNDFEDAVNTRANALLTYVALTIFRGKSPRTTIGPQVKRDAKYFWGSFKNATEKAESALFALGDTDFVSSLIQETYAAGIGQVDEKARYWVSVSDLVKLPAELQIIFGMAEWLHGDFSEGHVVRYRPETGKVHLFKYDHFESYEFPLLSKTIRISLKSRWVDVISHDEDDVERVLVGRRFFQTLDREDVEKSGLDQWSYSGSPLALRRFHALRKDAFISLVGYNGHAFNVDLSEVVDREFSDIGSELENGPRLVNNSILPSLDMKCGRYLTFRDLIECGETQEKTGLKNIPSQMGTYEALEKLCLNIVDEVIDEYGMIKLTYGFCSAELAKQIPGHIDPKLDQHSACELNRKGSPICKRLGAACDFLVEYESMLEVAQWIINNCRYDRLYFYGDDRPIHVSFGPEEKKQIVLMPVQKSGRRVPRVISEIKFLALSVSETI